MRIVAENSDADLARQRATERVEWALRELAANVLRVVRGAGKPHELGLQAQTLVEVLGKYYEAAGHFPFADDVSRFLSVDPDHALLATCSEESRDRAYAEQRIIRGVLQVVASRLVDQKTQGTAGHSAMYDGIRELEELRAANRRAMKQASTGRAEARRSRRRSRRPPAAADRAPRDIQ